MRILRLALEAFGPFRDRFEVDFASFEGDGVYLIAGPTGAGKSTVLDAISFALYGSAPRYDERAHLRSDLAGPGSPTVVELDVQLGDRVLRVLRSPEYERPKARGTGTTREPAKATLLERTADGWDPVATTAREVGHEVARLVGLTKQEFLQVILLAQGGFAEFLRATSDERKALLLRLFGTGDLGRLRDLLDADRKALAAEREAQEALLAERGRRVREAAAALAAARAEADPAGADADPEAVGEAEPEGADDDIERTIDEAELDALVAALAAATEAAEGEASRAREAERSARAARDDAREQAALLRRRDAARAALEELERAAEAVDADRARLDAAERAAEAAGALDRWARADAALLTADAALELAAAELPDDVDAEREAVEAAHGTAVDDAAVGQAAAELERALPRLAAATARAAAEAEEAAAALEAARAERTAGPTQREALVGAREAASTAAAGAEAAEAAVATAAERLEAARDAARLAVDVDAARVAATAALAAARDASAHAAALQEARIAGIAGELAAGLAEGDPCPVCGATDHPSPAAPSADAATPEAVAAAWERAEAATAAVRAADAALAEVDARRAARAAVAGDDDAAALGDALEAARAERERAREAAAERARLQGAIEAHDAAAAALEARIATLEAEAAERREHAGAAAAREADVHERLADALEGRGSAAELLAHATARRDALHRWLDADAGSTAARTEAAEAAEEGGAALEAHGFADRAAATAARLEPDERAALRRRIRDHDDREASARGVLAQPELEGLGDEAPDLEPLEAALQAATAAQRAAARAEAEADQRRRLALDDAAEARAALAALADGAAHAAALRSLAGALRGENPKRQDIETYVLATRLAAIVDAANLRLSGMTGGRFALVHDESTAYRGRASGLGLLALDAHTGKARTTESLSGGETFLASLALALGLADVVQAEAGGVSLETLFVDEGFGSLDADTLEQAMAVLDDLRAGGRSVGVISHVQQMQERIPARIRVMPEPGGGSRIEVLGVQPG
ncbi:AAA family ATPase [Agrococcus terreus]|uniref:AAA family ATPase n=1 Tax=Agrococcus terreus TaxID=574649 RepID=UPI0038510CB2